MQSQIMKETEFSGHQAKRFTELADKGYTPEGIDNELGCGVRKARRILKMIRPGEPVNGPFVMAERSTYESRRSELNKKPPQKPTVRKMRKCLGPNCGEKMFMSAGVHNRICRNCKCSSDMQIDPMMAGC